jgi:vancomycin resistance protein VanJ
MTKQKARRRWPARIAWLSSWTALAVALVGWLGLTALADRNGVGTLLAFGPSWLMVVPAVLSIPFALWGDRRALIPLAWAGLVVAWPVMGWNFPWRALTAETTPEDLSLRLLTINKGMVKTFDPIALRNLIIEREAQVVLMQEASGMTLDQLRLGEEWTLKANGELVVISRLPIDRVEALTGTEHDGKAAALRCDIRTPKGTVHVIAIHLRSAREGITAAIKHGPFQYGVIGSNLQERSATSLAVAEWVAGIPMMEPGPVVVGGDFNLPPASALLARHWGWLRDSHLDAGWGWGLTWFSSWHGLRIDHLMADPEARWTWSEVGPNVGSDHRPLLAEVHWTAPN